nr:hypothetical protein [Tanacetum cinerariifolium]GEW24943.1 hypothetical protein [Tanacetum cinerariifolium]
MDQRVMLLAHGVTKMWVPMQLIRQGLFIATNVRVKVIWTDSVLNQKGQGILSDCDEAPSAKAMLMANLSSYDFDVLSEVPISDTFQDNFVLNHCVQEMYYSEQPAFVHTLDIETTSDNNITSYDQYMKENESKVVQDTTYLEQKNDMIMSVIDEMFNQVAKCNADFNKGLHLEINEMKVVFNQMESEVEQCYVDKCFEIQKKERFLKNDLLLELIISQDLVHTVVHSYGDIVDYVHLEKSYLDEYNECLKLKDALSKMNEMVEKAVYNELSKRC